MARLDLNTLDVETFPTVPEESDSIQFTGSTGYCCDTNRDCSSACRRPTNICEVCG